MAHGKAPVARASAFHSTSGSACEGRHGRARPMVRARRLDQPCLTCRNRDAAPVRIGHASRVELRDGMDARGDYRFLGAIGPREATLKAV